jgi:hypothetical protein
LEADKKIPADSNGCQNVIRTGKIMQNLIKYEVTVFPDDTVDNVKGFNSLS